MGQYWEWLSYGIKWFEQFSASGMYSGIMMLKTDVSSLGHGGGDLQVDEVPAPLQPLVKAVLGRWTGDIIELAGDYGTIQKKYEDDAFTDISPNVAAAVFSVYHEYWYDSDKSADDNIESLKHRLPEHPDFDYYSVKDMEFVRLIKMALKSAAGVSSSAAAASSSEPDSASNRGKRPRGAAS